MTQTYTHPLAIQRMSEGKCPECGDKPEDHTGRGSWNCTLTDNGVASRIHQYQQDQTKVQPHSIDIDTQYGPTHHDCFCTESEGKDHHENEHPWVAAQEVKG